MRGWQFTSPSLDLHDQIRGKKSEDDPDETVLLSQRDDRGYNNCHQRTAGGILALAGKAKRKCRFDRATPVQLSSGGIK
jgi:hypothetical protein